MRNSTFNQSRFSRLYFFIAFLLLISFSASAQFYTKHYIAPAPWQYFSKANEIVISTNSLTEVTITLAKSDGTFEATLKATKGAPAVYRFKLNASTLPMNALNTVLNGAGLIITSTGPTAVNLRNVASDDYIRGENVDANIKGNAALTSFGDAGLGIRFRVGYYRDGSLGNFGSLGDQRPIYSVMATANNTTVKIDNTITATLNAGQSYLFKAPIGTLVETSNPAVMNTAAGIDMPDGCGDGAYNQIPPEAVLGTEYFLVRGTGNDTAEQTTVVATKDDTNLTINGYSTTGALVSTVNVNLPQAGKFYTFKNGVPNNGNSVTSFTSSRVFADKRVAVYSGTAQSCEVDISTIAPVSECGGSNFIETAKFKNYQEGTLDYFGYILLRSATEIVTVNGTNIANISGIAPRYQIGTTGWYLINFNSVQIGSPEVLSIASDAKLTVSIVQQAGGFSMAGFFSNFAAQPDEPTLTYISGGGCTNNTAELTTPANFAPYQWYFNGTAISGANSSTYTATKTGNYTVSSTLACGAQTQSKPVSVTLCTDLGITKTVDNATPCIGSNVEFTVKVSNLGGNNVSGVSVNDLLPSGYTYVSSTPSVGVYNSTTGIWSIGDVDAQTSVTLKVTATVNASGNYTNTASLPASIDINTANNSASAAVNPNPAVTLVTNAVTACAPSADLTASTVTAGSSNNLTFSYWTNALATTVLTNPNAVTSGGTYYIKAVSAEGCTVIKSVSVSIVQPSSKPSITFSSGSATACSSTSVILRSSGNSGSYLWSTGETTREITVTTDGTYSVRRVNSSGCISEVSDSVVIKLKPSAPTATSPQSFCASENKKISDLVATGSNLKWYNNSGTQYDPNTTLTAGTYYVRQTAANGCESDRTSVQVNISSSSAPVASAQTFCAAENKKISDLVVSGDNLKWYSASTGGTQYLGTETLVTRNYYVSQTAGSCTESARTLVAVTINDIPSAPTASSQTFCGTDSKTVSNLSATGSNLKWYSASTGGTLYNGNEALSTGNYYVSQTNNCGESTRTTVAVIVNNTAAPTASSQSFCLPDAKKVSNLVATGTGLKWYSASTGGTLYIGTETLTTGTYYVSQTLNSCESARTAVAVTVYNTAAPTANSQSFCAGDAKKVSDLTVASGTNLKWYSASSGGTLYTGTETLASGNYYVSQTLNNCESSRILVAVTVNPTPATPSISAGGGSTTFCTGGNVVLTSTSGIGYLWSNGATTQSITVSNSGSYSVQVTNASGCLSASSTAVNVTVNTIPSPPTASDQAFCSIDAKTVSDLAPSGAGIKWYSSNSASTAYAGTETLSTGTYYVSQTTSGCESARTAVNVTVNPKQADVVTNATICSEETYTWTANNTVYSTTQSGIRISNNGCTADQVLNLTVTPKPADVVTNATICSGETYTWTANNTAYSTTQSGTRISNNGCTADQVLNLTVTPKPADVVTNATICSGETYTWTVNNTVYSTTQNGTRISNNGCTADQVLNLTVTPKPADVVTNATICSGETYTWTANNTVYSTTQNGTRISNNGCTADQVLNLTVTPKPADVVTNATICSGETYTWTANNTVYSTTQSGTRISNNGCTADQVLNLTVTPKPADVVTNATICSGETYTWTANNTVYSTTQIGTRISNNGCTADQVLNLTVTPKPADVVTNATICSGETYTWTANNTAYSTTQSGTRISNNGCTADQVLNLTVTPKPADVVTNATICSGETYTWTVNNTVYSTTQNGTRISNNGCTADQVLNLTVTPKPADVVTNATICSGETYTWTANNTVYSTTQIGTRISNNGCTADQVLNLTVTPKPADVVTNATICSGETYTWTANNTVYSTTQNGTRISNNGCTADQVLNLTVTPKPADVVTNATICSGETYTWTVNNTVYSTTQNGTRISNNGCTADQVLNLTVTPKPADVVTNATICSGETYTWTANNTVYSTTQNGTRISNNGCTADQVLNLTVTPKPADVVTNATICSGETYTWTANNTVYSTTQSGTRISNNGCTADQVLNLTVTPKPADVVTNATICSGETYTWTANNTVYSTTQIGTRISNNGCTADQVLNLTVTPKPADVVTNATICSGETYTWTANNTAYSTTQSGTRISNNGCTADQVLNLTVTPKPADVVTNATICSGETYTWTVNNTVYSTTQNGTRISNNGCTADQVLNLTVTPKPADVVTNATICSGETYTWTANNTVYSTTQIGTRISNNGCTADQVLNLTVTPKPADVVTNATICSGETYTWTANNTVYSTTQNGTRISNNGCTADQVLNLTVTPKPADVVTNAAICSGETYTWTANNTVYSTTQIGTRISNNGCTADQVLNLTVTPKPADVVTNATICSGETYTWTVNNTVYSTTQNGTRISNNGCTADQVLNLTVTPKPADVVTNATICSGETYTWTANNTAYSTTQSGTRISNNGCTADQVLNLTVTPKPADVVTNATICSGETYTWTVNNTVYSTTQIGTRISNNGCTADQVLNLTVTPKPADVVTNATICSGETYTWTANNTAYSTTQSGTRISNNGCTADQVLNLTVTPKPADVVTNATICSGETYTWTANNTVYSTTQIGTRISNNGCTADQVLNLTVTPKPADVVTNATICSGETYTWTANNTAYSTTQSGTRISNNGCTADQVLNLTVTPKPADVVTNATICSGETYTWTVNNTVYSTTQNGTRISNNGCTADQVLNLTVTPKPADVVTNATICSGETYTWTVNNTVYSTTQIGTRISNNGCTADQVLNLTVTPKPADVVTNATICSGETYTWTANNTAYSTTQSGTRISNNGCTADQVLNLTVTPKPADVVTNATICSGETYTWTVNNTVYSTTQNGTRISNNGCTADQVLNLTVTPKPADVVTNATICSGETYTWTANNTVYSTTQNGTRISNNGCTADQVLNLTVTPKPADVVTNATICSGETYTWTANNTAYSTTQSGTRISNNGCTADQVLNLTVTPKPADVVTNATICSGETYTWTANNTVYSTTQIGTRISNNGCTADQVLNLTVTPKPADVVTNATICSGETYTWTANNTAYSTTQSGTRISNNGCTADQVLNLTVTPKPADVVTNATICSGETYTWTANNTVYSTTQSGTRISNNGCTADQVLNLTVTPKPAKIITTATICSGDTYTWSANSTDYTISGTYPILNNGCTADQELQLTVTTVASPIVGLITQPTCSSATASVELSGLPTGNWTINPGNITGNTATITITGLMAGNTHNYKVTDNLGCESVASSDVKILDYICAENDTPSTINGAVGGTISTVFVNDKINGSSFLPTDISVSTGSLPTGIVFNSDGTITVAPNTSAGTHLITYTICMTANASICDSATVEIVIERPIIDAVTETTTAINSNAGGTTASLTANDTLNGSPVTVGTGAGEVSFTLVSTLPSGLTLNADKTITVAPGTASGSYEVEYTICDNDHALNCDTVKSYVQVVGDVLVANEDSPSAVTASNQPQTIITVTDNDTRNGQPLTASEVKITTTVADPSGHLTLDRATGTVTLGANAPAGTYTLTYSICDKTNTSNCSTATVSLTVNAPIVIPVIDAVTETTTAINSNNGGTTASLTANDTLNGSPLTIGTGAGEVSFTLVSTLPSGLTLNADKTITVAPGTASGSYEVEYTICDNDHALNCDTVKSYIQVVGDVLVANADNPASVAQSTTAQTIITVTDNDTRNGQPLTASEVKITTTVADPSGYLVLDPTTGTVTLGANAPAGTYTLTYSICDKTNASSRSTATVSLTVNAPVVIPVIDAVTETTTAINSNNGGTTASLTANDTLNGSLVTIGTGTGEVNFTLISTLPSGLTLNADKTITVAPGTASGSYEVEYTICDNDHALNCDTVKSYVQVVGDVLVANADSPSAVTASNQPQTIITVTDNDTRNGQPLTASEVKITTTVADPSGYLVLDPTTGTVALGANAPAGTYTLTYSICDKTNTSNCSTATVSLTVNAPIVIPVIDAVTETTTAINRNNGGTTVSLTANDTLNGSPVTVGTGAGEVSFTLVSTLPSGLTLNADKTITVAPGTASGSYEVEYTICDNDHALNCDTVKSYVQVVGDVLVANADNPASVAQSTTAQTIITVTDNDTRNGQPLTASEVKITTTVADRSGHLTLDPATGTVTLGANAPAGTYTLTYSICDKTNTSNCSTATVSLTVNAPIVIPVIDAVTETTTAINSNAGGTTASLTANDTLNGSPVTVGTGAGEVSFTLVSVLPSGLTLNADKTITVAPGTASGSYEVEYTICDNDHALNCDTVKSYVLVTGDLLVLKDDLAGPIAGVNHPVTVVNVLGNDTKNGLSIAASDVNLSVTVADPTGYLTLNPDGTIVLKENAPAGTYELTYQVCELNTTNCATANVKVSVVLPTMTVTTNSYCSNDVPYVSYNVTPDNFTTNNLLTVKWIDSDNNVVATQTNLPLSGNILWPGAIVDSNGIGVDWPGWLLTNGRWIEGADGFEKTRTGVTMEFSLNPTVNVVVSYPPATPQCNARPTFIIKANNDSAGPIDAKKGISTALNIFSNDRLNGIAVNQTAVVLTTVIANPNLILNADGSVDVKTGTASGTYQLTYQICEASNLSNCSQAVVNVTVVNSEDPAPAPQIVTKDDLQVSVDGVNGQLEFVNILDNDLWNGLPIDPANVVISNTPKSPYFEFNADGTVNVKPNTPAGTYALVYQVCEKANSSNCSSSTLNVFVEVPNIAIIKTAVFNDENANGFANAGETISYKFKVTNTGNVPLKGIAITDPLPGVVVSGQAINLEVGESNDNNFTAKYKITQSDIIAGKVSNQATALGKSARGVEVEDKSDDMSNTGDNPTVLDLDGCKVKVLNAFSPNGDLKNARFYIQGIECYPDNTVEIYNRWGVLVFDIDHYNNEDRVFVGFSGGRVTIKESDGLPGGTYFYTLKYKDNDSNQHEQSGYLYLNK